MRLSSRGRRGTAMPWSDALLVRRRSCCAAEATRAPETRLTRQSRTRLLNPTFCTSPTYAPVTNTPESAI
jgi:hypothetical protein